jgi:hypothetical protein
MGRVALCAGLLVAVGFLVLKAEGLVTRLPGTGDGLDLIMLSQTAWFAITAVVALQAARQRRYAEHARWMLRHVAAGIWVAVQRILVLAATMVVSAAGGTDRDDVVRVRLFYMFGAVSSVLCMGCAELALLSGWPKVN